MLLLQLSDWWVRRLDFTNTNEAKTTMPVTTKLVGVAVLLFSCVAVGWQARGWYEDSERLAVKEMADEMIRRSRLREANIAAAVNSALSSAVLKERTVVRELQPIVERPVYEINCIDADGLDLINSLSRNDND